MIAIPSRMVQIIFFLTISKVKIEKLNKGSWLPSNYFTKYHRLSSSKLSNKKDLQKDVCLGALCVITALKKEESLLGQINSYCT